MDYINKIILLLILIFITATVSFAQNVFSDPDIPNKEKTSYIVKKENETYPITQTVKHITGSPAQLYEIISESKENDQKIHINRKTMAVVYSWVKNKKPDYEIEIETKINRNTIKAKKGEVIILNFEGINHVLRGFPFSKNQTVKIKTAAGGDFVLNLVPKGKKEIKTKMGIITCYELELGMDGFFGAFFPKTYLWYSVASPHYLVKYEGPSGGTGSPNMVIEITSYSEN